MLDQHPVLRETLIAVSTFALILFGGAVCMDFLLTNGMQWGSDPRPSPSFDPTIQAAPPADNFVAYSSREARGSETYAGGRTGAQQGLRSESEVPHAPASPGVEVGQLDAVPKEQLANEESKYPAW